MAAVPVGYEAFHSLRRKGVTLLCFLLASTMAMGIAVYVDSYSIHEWDKNLDVGDIAIRVSGSILATQLDDIRNIPGVTKAEGIRSIYGSIFWGYIEEEDYWENDFSGDLVAPSQDFLEAFPNYVQFTEGRTPQNESEIALIQSLRSYYDVEIGQLLNLSSYDFFDTVQVVGFYKHESEIDSPYYWRFESLGIVVPSVIDEYYEQYEVCVDVNRASLTAFNPSGSLAYMSGIDQAIRELDPFYDPVYQPWSNIYVSDRLASGISYYIMWVQGMRIAQMLRSTSILLLVILVTFLAIRHNVNERRYEENMLVSRGASKGDLEKIVTREVLILAIISCLLGIPLGILFSRFALAATSYFVFDITKLISEPLLVSLDSLVIALIVGIVLPMITLGGYRIIYSTKKNVDEERGKVAKIAKGFNLIRWDLITVIIAGLILLALSTGGATVSNNAILALVMPIIPLPLFLGVASLSMKALKRGANWISRRFKRLVGEIPSSIGIRRIGKEASSAGAAAMVLVLAICLSWNSAIIDASLPVTAENQARLYVGSDLTFALDSYYAADWDEFITNVTQHELVLQQTMVSELQLYLTSNYWDGREFLAIDPLEYAEIGYDYLGNRLNESGIFQDLELLENTPDGAILSADIAQEFNFEIGDILRATSMGEDTLQLSFRILSIVEALPEMPERSYYYDYYGPYYDFYPGYYSGYMVGSNRVLVNRDFIGTQFNLVNDTNNYLCVSTRKGANTTTIVSDLFAVGGSIVVSEDIWDGVNTLVEEYIGGTQYKIERALDTMLTFLTIGTIVGAFTIYAVEGLRSRRREIALLRSVGAARKIIISAQSVEMLILLLFSLFLLLLYSPLFLSTSLAIAGGSTIRYGEIFPISVFTVIPWNIVLLVLGFFIAIVSMFIVVIAALSSKINLAEALNTAWAEAGPYGGDV
ncbi:MAG: hypothetical protein JW779_02790 [Candidatus Thorarchaeota archaeon]|nr:hypothetical protein [Candidatus Thorarchaeota archaeon]